MGGVTFGGEEVLVDVGDAAKGGEELDEAVVELAHVDVTGTRAASRSPAAAAALASATGAGAALFAAAARIGRPSVEVGSRRLQPFHNHDPACLHRSDV